MGPKTPIPQSKELFGFPLAEHLNMSHPLVRMAGLINWDDIEAEFAGHFVSERGRPALPPRLIAGLLYLQHTFDCSDELVVNTWVENPYWQYFTGETYLQIKAPIDPSSLTRWRKRIGESGVETLLMVTIDAAQKGGALKKQSMDRVIVDTTVMPKAVAYPTDSNLLETSRQHMVKMADDNGIKLRQNYNREAPRLAAQIGRYAHAKQYKRMNKAIKTLKTRVGRIHREMNRALSSMPEQVQPKAKELLGNIQRVLTQRRTDKNKIYSLHAPEVECISKGKSRTPYEFGVKVSIATTLKEGYVVGMRSMPGNPWDGHTLEKTLQQVSILNEHMPSTVIVDKGYKGVEINQIRILRSGQRRGITKSMKAMIKRRSAIEPAIGHMKMDGRLARNPLKGALGDALHAVMCGAGHNMRLLLKRLRLLLLSIYSHVMNQLNEMTPKYELKYQTSF